MKKTDDLIDKLTKNHQKINRDYAPIVRTIIILYAILLTACLVLYLLNPFEFVIKNRTHALEVAAIFFLIHSLVYLGFKAMVPGEEKKKALSFVGINLLLTLIAFFNRMTSPQLFHQMRTHCEVEAVAISFATTLICHCFLRKNEYARRNFYSSFLIISLPLIATFIMHGVCSLDLEHVVLCHFMCPLLIPVAYITITKSRILMHRY